VELKLVTAVTSMGKTAEFHPTMAVPSEKLPKGFLKSNMGFLICTKIHEVKVNHAKVKRDTKHLQKYIVLAYFIKGKQPMQLSNQLLEYVKARL
jgi:hypothetical protein